MTDWKKVAAKVLKEHEGKAMCEHCLKWVGFTKSKTGLGARFMRAHPIGKPGSMRCQGSGLPEKLSRVKVRA